FLDQARTRGLQNLLAMVLDRSARRCFDLKAEFGREANRADHPHRVLAHPEFRIADRSDQSRLEIRDAANIIDHAEGSRVVEERVDGEVPPKGVFLAGAE